MVLSLQGCMAVGKTSAARWLEAHDPTLQVSYEDNAAVLAEVRRRGLDKTRWPDYIEIQRLWLQNEVRRWQAVQGHPCTVMDFGAEEIEFYTLHYPRSIGRDWAVEGPLARELAAVRRCMPRRILFPILYNQLLMQEKLYPHPLKQPERMHRPQTGRIDFFHLLLQNPAALSSLFFTAPVNNPGLEYLHTSQRQQQPGDKQAQAHSVNLLRRRQPHGQPAAQNGQQTISCSDKHLNHSQQRQCSWGQHPSDAFLLSQLRDS